MLRMEMSIAWADKPVGSVQTIISARAYDQWKAWLPLSTLKQNRNTFIGFSGLGEALPGQLQFSIAAKTFCGHDHNIREV